MSNYKNNYHFLHVELEDGTALDKEKSHDLFFKSRFGGRYIKSTITEDAEILKEMWRFKDETFRLVFSTNSSDEEEAELQEG